MMAATQDLIAAARAYGDGNPGGFTWLLNRLADALEGVRDPDWFLAYEDVRAALEAAWDEGWRTSDGYLANPYRLKQALANVAKGETDG